MKKLFISFSFVFILIFAGCKDTPTQPLDTSVIWPLNKGNYWKYKTYNYDYNGKNTDTMIFHKLVTSDTIINGYSLKNIKGQIENSIYGHYNQQLKCNEQGIWYFTNDSLFLWNKFPINKNEFFIRKWWDTVFVISIDEKVIVPAGTFYCYVYKNIYNSLNLQYIIFDYFAPGIGPIKSEIYQKYLTQNEYLYKSLELISFKLF